MPHAVCRRRLAILGAGWAVVTASRPLGMATKYRSEASVQQQQKVAYRSAVQSWMGPVRPFTVMLGVSQIVLLSRLVDSD